MTSVVLGTVPTPVSSPNTNLSTETPVHLLRSSDRVGSTEKTGKESVLGLHN